MNIRAVSVLDQYDLEVLRTGKVRSAILCEAKEGTFLLKEYQGHGEKLLLQDAFLKHLQGNSYFHAEMLLANKEGSFFSTDFDGNRYIVKTYEEGQECDIHDLGDCVKAVVTLARFHQMSISFNEVLCPLKPGNSILYEFEKRNRELMKVRKYLRQKKQKSEFERALQGSFDYFLEKALEITQELQKALVEIPKPAQILCHGDFQYHNLFLNSPQPFLMNFEKCVWDDSTRDLYHFMRKAMEKWDWSEPVGTLFLDTYGSIRPISKWDGMILYYRFAYPEKFWKIVNYYYNTDKSFIPWKNQEKLQILSMQEEKKLLFLQDALLTRFFK